MTYIPLKTFREVCCCKNDSWKLKGAWTPIEDRLIIPAERSKKKLLDGLEGHLKVSVEPTICTKVHFKFIFNISRYKSLLLLLSLLLKYFNYIWIYSQSLACTLKPVLLTVGPVRKSKPKHKILITQLNCQFKVCSHTLNRQMSKGCTSLLWSYSC